MARRYMNMLQRKEGGWNAEVPPPAIPYYVFMADNALDALRKYADFASAKGEASALDEALKAGHQLMFIEVSDAHG